MSSISFKIVEVVEKKYMYSYLITCILKSLYFVGISLVVYWSSVVTISTYIKRWGFSNVKDVYYAQCTTGNPDSVNIANTSIPRSSHSSKP